MTVQDPTTLKSYFTLTKVPTPSQYGDLIDTIFDQGEGGGGGSHDHDERYVKLLIADTISAVHTFSPSIPSVPFILAANAQGQTVTGFKADQLSKSILAGDGLTGGGVLTSDATLNVGAGDGITVSANAVGLTIPGTLSVSSSNNASGSHTHAITTSNAPGESASILATNANGLLNLFHIQEEGIDVIRFRDFIVNNDYFQGGGRSIQIPEIWNEFQNAGKRFSVTPSGWNACDVDSLFDGNFDNFTTAIISANTSGVLTIDLLGKGEYGAGGIIYPEGYIYVYCYYEGSWHAPYTISGRIQDFYDTWHDLTNPTYIYPDIWRITIPGIAYGETIELTITAETSYETRIVEIQYFRTRGGIGLWAVPKKVQEEKIYHAWYWNDSNNSAKIKINPLGDSYFNGVNLAIGQTSASYPLDVNGTIQSTTTRTNTLTNASGENITISPTGDISLDPGGFDVLPLTNYEINLGTLNKKYLTIHAAELWVETLVAQNTIATIGGRILVAPTTTLTRDFSASDTMFYSKHNNMVPNDIVYLESNGKVEWIRIDDDGTLQGAGDYQYARITRDLDLSGPNDWYAGDAILNTGTTGDGYIDLYSDHSIRGATQYGPSIVGNIRIGTTYSNLVEGWAVGNLNGIYGYGVDVYGAAFGEYINEKSFITIEPTNGIRMMYKNNLGGNVVLAQWDNSGNLTIGEVNASKDNIYISSGAISLRVNTTTYINMSTAGIITVGLSSGPNTLIQSTGISLRNSTTTYIDMTSAGVITIGQVGVSQDNIYLSAGEISLRVNTAEYINMSTTGIITVGLSSGPNTLIQSSGISLRNSTTTYINMTSAGVITVGEVGASKDNIYISSGALYLRNNTTNIISLTSAGVVTIGQVGASQDNLYLASGEISLRVNTTAYINMSTSGAVRIGAVGSPYTYFTSTAMFFRRSDDVSIISIDSADESITIGVPSNVRIDDTGVRIKTTGVTPGRLILDDDITHTANGMLSLTASYPSSGEITATIAMDTFAGDVGTFNQLLLKADTVTGSTGKNATVDLYSAYNAGASYIKLKLATVEGLGIYDGYTYVAQDFRVLNGLAVGVSSDPDTKTIYMAETTAPAGVAGVGKIFMHSSYNAAPFCEDDLGNDIPMGIFHNMLSPFDGYYGSLTVTAVNNTYGVACTPTGNSIFDWCFPLPRGWAGKTISLYIYWSSSDANSGNVFWAAEGRRLANGVTIPSSATVSGNITQAAPGVQYRIVAGTAISLALSSFSEADSISLRLYRAGDNAGDTYASNCYLHAIKVSVVG